MAAHTKWQQKSLSSDLELCFTVAHVCADTGVGSDLLRLLATKRHLVHARRGYVDVFCCADRADGAYDFTLAQYLTRQQHMLHGFEARDLKYIPKVSLILIPLQALLHRCQGLQLMIHFPMLSDLRQ